jgi:hypothetical protein
MPIDPPGDPLSDPVLVRFRAALDALYGDRIERVVLFGSRARGDAREDSDYDIAVFLRDLTDRRRELDRLARGRPRGTSRRNACGAGLDIPAVRERRQAASRCAWRVRAIGEGRAALRCRAARISRQECVVRASV